MHALRVQMRMELVRLQKELKVTTVYVTHDQIEAMTMGDRIAVLDHGVLAQLDTPGSAVRRACYRVCRHLHRLAEDEHHPRE